MATSKFRKYIWLLDRLYYHRKGMTLQELQNDWTMTYGDDEPCVMSDRTFSRLRRETEDLFGVDIECVTYDGYRYRLVSESIDKDNLRKWLLNTFVVSNRIADSKQLSDRIVLEDVPSGYTHLIDVLLAMKESKRMAIEYQSFKNVDAKRIEVAPYCIKASKRRWYLLGEVEGKLRMYAFDRIVSLSMMGESSFVMPEKFDAEEYFANTIGVSVEAEDYEVETIKLKVYSYNHKDKYINTLPLHPTQTLVEETDEYAIFEYRLRATYEFFHEILALGEEVEILSPQWVRDDMRWYIEEMLKRYK